MSSPCPFNITYISTRAELRDWFAQHETGELFLPVNRSRKPKEGVIDYVDAVMEALCWGWIDSTLRNIDGVLIQRFSPRRKNSHWTELNLERCQQLEAEGLMTDRGRAALPKPINQLTD